MSAWYHNKQEYTIERQGERSGICQDVPTSDKKQHGENQHIREKNKQTNNKATKKKKVCGNRTDRLFLARPNIFY